MKSEFVNLFKFAVNFEGDEMYLVFERARPVLKRDSENIQKVTHEGTVVEEIAAVTLNLDNARQLADEIYKQIGKKERGDNVE